MTAAGGVPPGRNNNPITARTAAEREGGVTVSERIFLIELGSFLGTSIGTDPLLSTTKASKNPSAFQ